MITVDGCLWGKEIGVRLGREAKNFFFHFILVICLNFSYKNAFIYFLNFAFT